MIRNNVKVAQMLAGKMSMHPVAPQVRIRRCKIPRRPDLAPEGLKVSEKKGEFGGEWQQYGGWFKKAPVNRFDGYVDPKERVILYAHGGLYCIGAIQTHRGVTWRLGYSAKARVLCTIFV